MSERSIRKNSLLLYKNQPALAITVGDKLEIALESGKTIKVRSKDVDLLHPGPLQHLRDLTSQEGDVSTAWELLAGEITTLPDLAELIYDDYTPATAWATWQLVADGLYFEGTPDSIEVASARDVSKKQAARDAKAAEAAAWRNFLLEVETGNLPEDPAVRRFLNEVEAFALGQAQKSRVLQELGRPQTREAAHTLLLTLKYWDEAVNPHPRRLGILNTPSDVPLPALPDEERRDLTHLPALAIDDAGSRDADDAISLDGNRLWIHVADVAALIAPDSVADEEAKARGANLYLPENTIPMLPPAATDLLALGLSDVSPALSFGLTLGPGCEVLDFEVVPSWVKVQRFSYDEVETRLDEAPFKALHDLALEHQERRRANGGIFMDLPEVKMRVEAGQVVIRPLPPLQSRDLVREAMLMAGEAAARFALREGIAFPFSTQEVLEIPEELANPSGLADMFALRRCMKRSQLSTIPSRHEGLGLDTYSQVTSPLRRYLDLVCHQQLRAHIQGKPVLTDRELLDRVGSAEAVTGTVRQAERLALEHWTGVYFLQNPEWQGEGILVEKRGRKGVFLIPELGFETQVSLRQDWPLDGAVPLAVRQVNLPELTINFRAG
ncbi:MAG: RNB domain-containing ribonuclease [Chloroflexota bacterium]